MPRKPERSGPPHDDGDELSPEVALVDPDVAERARDALPDITLTEIRLSLSLKVEQAARPPAPQPSPEPVAVARAAPAPALVRPADAPAPPGYDDVRRVFHEPRLGPRHRRRLVLAALVILAVAAGVALAVPRALDGPTTPTPTNRRSSLGAPAHPPSAAPAAHHQKAKAKARATSTAKGKARRIATPDPTRHARSRQKAKPARKKHAAAPPAPTRKAPKHKPKPRPVRSDVRVIPDFVWAPDRNARGYLVEFRAGSKVVLRVRTRAARLHATRLHRGRYRWLVWSLGKSGSPIGEPLVDSSVRVQ